MKGIDNPYPLIILLTFIFAVVFMVSYDEIKWHKYARENKCKLVSKKDDTTSIMLIPDGSGGNTIIPYVVGGDKGYLCADGKIHWH